MVASVRLEAMKLLTPMVDAGDNAAANDLGWAPLPVLVIALCFLLNMLDGADMLIMSFIAPKLAEEWSVSPESLGLIFGAGLAGMALGCLFVAPLADKVGRRKTIVGALVLVAVAMTISGYVTDVPQLMLARLFVGIGVGTIVISMTAMAAEFAPKRHANFAVGFVQAGWPLSAVGTAFIAATVIHRNPEHPIAGPGARHPARITGISRNSATGRRLGQAQCHPPAAWPPVFTDAAVAGDGCWKVQRCGAFPRRTQGD